MSQTTPARAGVSDIVSENATHRETLDLHRAALLGIAGKPGARVAILRSGSGKVETARYGDLCAAGIVMEIDETRAVFSRAGSELVLSLPGF